MAKKDASYMNRAYNEVTRFVERVPAGISWDVVLTKVAVLKTLNKSELVDLLARFRAQGNVVVIDTKREGDDVAYPVLKHKMHMGSGSNLTNVVGQVSDEPEPGLRTSFGPKRFSPENIIGHPTPGANVANAKAAAEMAYACKSADGLLSRVRDGVNKIDAVTPGGVDSVSDEVLINTIVKDTPPLNYGLSTELYISAVAILDTLKMYKAGLNRTRLGNLCMRYHRLNRDDRSLVITALIRHAGVVDYRSPTSSDSRSASSLLHPDHVKGVVCSKTTDTNASEKAEKEKIIAPAKPLVEPLKSSRLAGYRNDRAMNATDLYVVASHLHEHILLELSKPGVDHFLLRDIYAEFSEYSLFTPEERETVSKIILKFHKLRTYRGEFTNENIAYVTQDVYDRYMGIKKREIVHGNPLVYSTHTHPLETPTVTTSTKALETPTVTNHTKAPVVNVNENSVVAEPVKSPEASAITIPGLDAAALANMALMLQQASVLVENKQINDLVLEELAPLKIELNDNYKVLQENVSALLDSTTAIGITIEKLNNLLK